MVYMQCGASSEDFYNLKFVSVPAIMWRAMDVVLVFLLTIGQNLWGLMEGVVQGCCRATRNTEGFWVSVMSLSGV